MKMESKEEMDLITGGFMMGLLVASEVMAQPDLITDPEIVCNAMSRYASEQMEIMTGQSAEDIMIDLGKRVDQIATMLREK